MIQTLHAANRSTVIFSPQKRMNQVRCEKKQVAWVIGEVAEHDVGGRVPHNVGLGTCYSVGSCSKFWQKFTIGGGMLAADMARRVLESCEQVRMRTRC
jgi:hypothetical protein